MKPRLIDQAVLHVVPSSDSPESDAISAERLKSIVEGMSEIVSGLADEKRFLETDERSRSVLNEEQKAHYALYFRTPEPGSFALPCELYDTRNDIKNQSPILPDTETNFSQIAKLIQYANTGDRDAFYESIGSSVVANKIEHGIEKLAPTGTELIELAAFCPEEPAIPITGNAKANVIEWSSLCEGPFEQELIVTISAIDFDENQIKVKLASSGRKFKAPLAKELEGINLEAIREKRWKILCQVTYTPNGAISSIEAVHGIEELQLRQIPISSFTASRGEMKLSSPLVIQETLDDETQSLFVAEIPELDIFVYSESQGDLVAIINDELANKWEWIACAPDDLLTPRAKEVKRAFGNIVAEGVA